MRRFRGPWLSDPCGEPPAAAAAGITSAEAAMVALLAALVAAVVAAYILDLVGLRFAPGVMLPIAVGAAVATGRSLRRSAVPAAADTVQLALVMTGITAWLLWLARPALMPLSTGPDLTHHLLLIRYVEEHWRLVHDPGVQRFLGEMVQYTPGSHILSALAGAWSGTNGLRALHPLQAATVALKCGFLFLIARRLQPSHAPGPLAWSAVVLLIAAPRYFVGGFTEYGFVAQVVSELFTVAMWWAAVAWDAAPDWRIGLVFGCAGAAAFLTWPVYTGPPALAFFSVILLRERMPVAARVRHVTVSFAPMALVAVVYLAGRLGWLQLAATGGAAPWPSIESYSWPLVTLGVAGFGVCVVERRGRATVLFVAAVLAQTVGLFLLARRSGATQPYMALKMFYLVLWPMAGCASAAISTLWTAVAGAGRPGTASGPRARAAWGVPVLILMLAARPLFNSPQRLHPLPPAVSASLYDAGRWARENLPAGCIEYLVGDDETAYWLHLAVLGNPRVSARTGDNATYEPKDAVVRWLTPGGLPYAIADLPALSRDVRDSLDIVRQFGTAAIARRRGPSACAEPR